MINQKDKKRFRAIGHHLSPVITIAANGLSTNVVSELSRAIGDHELIKIRVHAGDREERKLTINEIKQQLGVEVVQSIGKVALIYKAASAPDPALSNLHRIDIF